MSYTQVLFIRLVYGFAYCKNRPNSPQVKHPITNLRRSHHGFTHGVLFGLLKKDLAKTAARFYFRQDGVVEWEKFPHGFEPHDEAVRYTVHKNDEIHFTGTKDVFKGHTYVIRLARDKTGK